MITDAKPGKITFLGRLGEHLTRKIRFYDGDVLRDYPGAEISVLNQRPGDADSYPVPSAYIEQDGDWLYWTIQSGDLAADGFGQCEMRAAVDGKVALSVVYATEIGKSLAGGDEPPEPWEGYVGQVIDAADRAEAAAQLLENPGAEAVTLEPGAQATAGYEDGTFTFGIPAGAPGQDGEPGEDGFSPSVSVSKAGGTATITITDKSGTTTAEITDGQPGEPGDDGYSPSASVSKSGGTATITITDKNGTTTADVQDGADGQDGAPGQDGQDGYTPVRGTDYWTAADQAQIVEDVQNALIDDTAGAGGVTKVWSASKSAGEVSALKSAIDGKAPVILRDASGDIVTVTDGADGMPLSSCVVSVDPVQDLHGQDSPYPAGGGKNIFNIEKWLTDTNIPYTKTGDSYTISPNSSEPYTNPFYFSQSDVAVSMSIASLTNINAVNARFELVDANGNVINDTYVNSVTIKRENKNASGVRLNWSTRGSFTVVAPMIELGSSATSYAPYSNICPISGHTGANVSRTGRNLLGGLALGQAIVDAVDNASYSTLGSNTDGNYVTIRAGSLIDGKKIKGMLFKPNTQYTLIFKITRYESGNNKNTNIRPVYTDGTAGSIVVSTTSNTEVKTVVYVTASGKTVDHLEAVWGGGTAYLFYEQSGIFEGVLTETDFEPYVGNVYPITFPDSAGTVYGGTLTVNQDGTGRLVVDANTFDMGDVNWTEYGGDYPNLFYTILTNAILPPNNFTIAQIKSTIYHVERSQNIGNVGYTNGYIGLNTGGRLYVNDVRYSSKQDFVSGVTGQKVWYKLATPITYDLTALEVIETLKGVNNIWADTGAISLTYPADTKSYVDDHTPVQDVQINGTSILSDGVANVPVASGSAFGVVKVENANYTGIGQNNGLLFISKAGDSLIKAGTNDNKPIVPSSQHTAAFYALAKLAGADMASSSNPVGTYTDAAKIAIQKMLGIYQAPWELIREDTFTNAEEADHIITVDGNGNAFELTDIMMLFELPTGEAYASKSYYGQTWFYYSASNYLVVETGNMNRNAGAASVGCWYSVRKEGNMFITQSTPPVSNTNCGNVRMRYHESSANQMGIGLLGDVSIIKINIRNVTGVGRYKLYGKRKWT